MKDYDFNSVAIEIFHYQKEFNPDYRKYLQLIGQLDVIPSSFVDIPAIPVELFKYKTLKSEEWPAECIFRSSGTTGMRSAHHIKDLLFYHANAKSIFENCIGPVSEYEFLGLLPNYQANPDSSLISMVDHFISLSKYEGGYFLNDFEGLKSHIEKNKEKNRPTILFGVSFALLEYASQFSHADLYSVTVVETGGMKKFSKEITRQDLQDQLRRTFAGANIVSEYGMTECLSQAYALNDRCFSTNDKMRLLITDPTDPLAIMPAGQKGRVKIVDIANVATISFISTDDIGMMHEDGKVEILGRLSNSDLRGCNYLI